jgi:hypothetical protein
MRIWRVPFQVFFPATPARVSRAFFQPQEKKANNSSDFYGAGFAISGLEGAGHAPELPWPPTH